jgi:hypothetical protein
VTCRRLEEDDLLAGLGEALDVHVEQCPDCSARAQGYRRIVGWIADGRPPHRPPAGWHRRTLDHVLATGVQLRSIPVDVAGRAPAGHSDPATDRSAVSPGATVPGSAGTRVQATAMPPRRPRVHTVWPIAGAAIVVGGWIAWAALFSDPQRTRVAIDMNERPTGEYSVTPGHGSVAAPRASGSIDHDSPSARPGPVESPAQPGGQGTTERSTKRGGAVVVNWPPEETSEPVKPGNVRLDPPTGSLGGFTLEEIGRVVVPRMGNFRACYQRELQRTPGIHGTLHVHIQIGRDGHVQAVDTAAPDSTLHSDAVAHCVIGHIESLRFPDKGGIASLNYAFEFTQ